MSKELKSKFSKAELVRRLNMAHMVINGISTILKKNHSLQVYISEKGIEIEPIKGA